MFWKGLGMRGRTTTGVASIECRVAKIPVRAEGFNAADIALRKVN